MVARGGGFQLRPRLAGFRSCGGDSQVPILGTVRRVRSRFAWAAVQPRKSASCDPSGAAGGRLRPGILPTT
jgi:hypothetical protein